MRFNINYYWFEQFDKLHLKTSVTSGCMRREFYFEIQKNLDFERGVIGKCYSAYTGVGL